MKDKSQRIVMQHPCGTGGRCETREIYWVKNPVDRYSHNARLMIEIVGLMQCETGTLLPLFVFAGGASTFLVVYKSGP